MIAYIMCGPIGSGKTHIAKSLYGHLPHFNPDDFMPMDKVEWTRKDSNSAWDLVHSKIKEYSGINLDFVVDSAQALPISRRMLTQYIREVAPSYKIVCIFVKTPFGECLYRNSTRDRIVPKDKMLEYYNNVMDNPPSRADGYDTVVVVDNSAYYGNEVGLWKTKSRWPKGWYHV